jgi:hypothetical protein
MGTAIMIDSWKNEGGPRGRQTILGGWGLDFGRPSLRRYYIILAKSITRTIGYFIFRCAIDIDKKQYPIIYFISAASAE